MSWRLSQQLSSFISPAVWVHNVPMMETRLAQMSHLVTMIFAQLKNLTDRVVDIDNKNDLLCNKVVDDIMAKLFLQDDSAKG